MVPDGLGRLARAIVSALTVVTATASAFAEEAGSGGSRTAPATSESDAARRSKSPDKERARQLYERGVAAYQEQRYQDALDALLASAAAYPSPLLYFNISLVYEAMGDPASALAWLRRYLRESGKTDDRDAEQKRARLEARLQEEGVQQITVFSDPDGGLVDVDGRPVGVAPLTAQLIPGRHQITVTLAGYDAAKETIELRADKSMDVRLVLSRARASAAIAAAEPTRATAPPSQVVHAGVPNEPEHEGGVSTFTIVALSTGAAALGTSLVFEILRHNTEQDARNASQADYVGLVQEMETQQTLSRIFLGVGAAATIAGAIKLGFDLGDGGQPRRRVGISSCGGSGWCGAIRGDFW